MGALCLRTRVVYLAAPRTGKRPLVLIIWTTRTGIACFSGTVQVNLILVNEAPQAPQPAAAAMQRVGDTRLGTIS